MNVEARVGRGAELRLHSAVLVYEGGGLRGSGRYITVHDVDLSDGDTPRLGAGRPADLAFVRDLAESVQQTVPPEVLPPHVLARTADTICWWSGAGLRPMHFRERSELGALSGRVLPQPALVWKIEGRQLCVRALAGDERPAEDTELFVAPYWNTDHDGRVCLGDMRRPDRLGIHNLREWEEGFFGSLFTGQNDRRAEYTKAAAGIVGLWRDSVARLRKEPRRFPVQFLEPAGETLREFVGGDRG